MTERREYTAEEVDAAVEALTDPERLRHAQEVVTHAAPALQRVVNQALEEGGWFEDAHQGQIARPPGRRIPTSGCAASACWLRRRRAWACWSA